MHATCLGAAFLAAVVLALGCSSRGEPDSQPAREDQNAPPAAQPRSGSAEAGSPISSGEPAQPAVKLNTLDLRDWGWPLTMQVPEGVTLSSDLGTRVVLRGAEAFGLYVEITDNGLDEFKKTKSTLPSYRCVEETATAFLYESVIGSGVEAVIPVPQGKSLYIWSDGLCSLERAKRMFQSVCSVKAFSCSPDPPTTLATVKEHGGKFEDLDAFGRVRTLYAFHLPAECVPLLAKLTELRKLKLADSAMTDASLKHLASLHRLKELDLTNIRGINGSGIKHIQEASSLSELVLDGTSFSDEGLAQCRFPMLTWLDLRKTHITDAGLSHLHALKQLTHLVLTDTQITDKSLSHLSGLKQLRVLMLQGTKVAGPGLSQIEGIELTCLDLRRCPIDDQALAHVGNMKSLRALFLSNTDITDAGVAHLESLSELRDLNLRETKISDSALGHLKKLKNLIELDIASTAVTDAGLFQLAGTQIEKVRAAQTKVTTAGAAQFQKKSPKTEVILDKYRF